MEAITLADDDPFYDLTDKETVFVVEYLKHGQRRKAAEAAEYGNPHVDAWRVIRRPRVQAALARFREAYSGEIASVNEALGILSEIARDGRNKASDRTAATAQLLKAQGAVGPEVDARTQTVNVSIAGDAPLEVLDAVDLLRRIGDSESSPFAAEARQVLAQILPGAEKALTPSRE